MRVMTADVRRAPRATHSGESVQLGSRFAVRVVNISLTGVLLETCAGSAGIIRGDRLDLSVPLGRAIFSARLEVGREDWLPEGKNGGRLRVGCAFVDLNAARRQQLAQFLADGLVSPRTDRAE
jgi:hypothetical protein